MKLLALFLLIPSLAVCADWSYTAPGTTCTQPDETIPESSGTIVFSKRKPIFKEFVVEKEVQMEEHVQKYEHRFRFYEVGKFTDGKYADKPLIVGVVKYKSEGYAMGDEQRTIVQRYVKNGKKLVRLQQLSNVGISDDVQKALARISKISITNDLTFTHPLLGTPPATLVLKGACVRFFMSEGSPLDQKINLVDKHPRYGDFYRDGIYFKAELPDKTTLSYFHLPPLEIETLGEKKQKFTSFWEGEKRDPGPIQDRIIYNDEIKDSDLVKYKTIPELGDLYREKIDRKARYRQYLKDAKAYEGEHALQTEKQFHARIRGFFWKDPFGRYVRYNTTEPDFPRMSEPILYFYPPHPMSVETRLDDSVRLTQSIPFMKNNRIRVDANPDGTFHYEGKRLQSLFWEGKSHFVPTPREGFVIAKTDLPAFFREKLTFLGLNEREQRDFTKYWLGRLTRYPFYLITFYRRDFIDWLAPLQITPKPDAIIRVMMDYVALLEPVIADEPKLETPPDRTGFTVVEWGGMERG